MGFGVWGLGFGVWGLGFGVWGLGFGVWGLGFGVWGLGFGVWGWGLGYALWEVPKIWVTFRGSYVHIVYTTWGPIMSIDCISAANTQNPKP